MQMIIMAKGSSAAMLMRVITLTLGLGAVLGACAAAPQAPSPAAPASAGGASRAERTCAGKLALNTNVRMAEIRPRGTVANTGGGYTVRLELNGAPWICRVDAAGQSTVQFQGEG